MIKKITEQQNELIAEFYNFSKYLGESGYIEDVSKYQNDISAFLLHTSHLSSYDFAGSFCKGKRILEIGCNIGYGTKVLAKFAKEVVAIDFARKNYALPNIKFEEVNATKLPYDDKTFDVVTSFQVIEHIKPDEVSNFLSEINRVLDKDGITLLTTPNRKLRLHPFEKPWNPEHYTEYTAKGFLKNLKNLFEDVKLLGLRSEKWVEKIEKDRVQKSFYRAYMSKPVGTFLKFVLPSYAVQKLKEVRSRGKLKTPNEVEKQDNFDELTKEISMESFRFTSNSLNESLYLLAICKKGG